MPLMNMVSNMGGHGLAKSSEELQPSIMSYRELEEGKECLTNSFKGTICLVALVDIGLHGSPCKGPLKEA